MQRRYEFMDLIVAIGLFATIVAGGLLFLAANGTLSLSQSRPSERALPIGTSHGMHWLQPVLGQAILHHDLLERRYKKAAPAAGTQLTGLIEAHRRWQNSPVGYLDSIKLSTVRGEADHRTRVQAVMGRSIVQFTQRGVLSGVLPPGVNDSAYNFRMIGSTEALRQRMNAQFLNNWQPNVGHAIVEASQEGAKLSSLRQEQLGAAIVRVTAIQTTYEGLRSTNQEQLGSATVVALQTALQAEPSDQTQTRQLPAVTLAPRVWPEVPAITILTASVMLMGTFMAGLFITRVLPKVEAVEVR